MAAFTIWRTDTKPELESIKLLNVTCTGVAKWHMLLYISPQCGAVDIKLSNSCLCSSKKLFCVLESLARPVENSYRGTN